MNITLEINSSSALDVVGPSDTMGWGDNGQGMAITGDIKELVVCIDGEEQFGIGIGSDGSLTLTDYNSMGFQHSVAQNFRLTPYRPWGTNR